MVSCGSMGVSRAITVMPLSRAAWMSAARAVEFVGVMRMPLTPLSTISFRAVRCDSTSTSLLPVAAVSVAPALRAESSATLRNVTQ